MPRVLIIEDQPDIAAVIAENLAAESFEVAHADTAKEGLERARTWSPDLVVLDLMLPDLPGEEVLATLRREGREVPVLILSARSDEATKVTGFRIGADDYVTKPFGLLELLARIDRLVRRASARPAPCIDIRFGEVEVRPGARRVLVGGAEVELRPKEMDLLLALAARPNEAVSRQDLLRTVWQYQDGVASRTVDWHMAELRRKLGDDPVQPRFLQTVRKVGYRLDVPAGIA